MIFPNESDSDSLGKIITFGKLPCKGSFDERRVIKKLDDGSRRTLFVDKAPGHSVTGAHEEALEKINTRLESTQKISASKLDTHDSTAGFFRHPEY